MSANSKSGPTTRVGLVSLGCAKNLVDAEIMLGSLGQSGMVLTNDAACAEVLIVNTCSFINSAQEESVNAILEYVALRERNNPRQAIIVAGCLPQRFRDELPKLMPEVDMFMGVDQVGEVAQMAAQALAHRAQQLAGQSDGAKPGARQQRAGGDRQPNSVAAPLVRVNLRPRYVPDYATPRFRLTPAHFAYVKIAEGCNHPCSFCTIPRMRGSYRSRPIEDLLAEARRLLAGGVKELNLISQDSTYYGLDLQPNRSQAISSPDKFRAAARALPAESATLCALLRRLDELPGDFWIRLLYTHPAHWTDELIDTIAECRKVARYVDIPLQHIHPCMLERMRRETSPEHIVELLGKIRARVPGIALRTTFIVGFPGETPEYFQALLEFIRQARFERLGVFAYSKEAGTRAGGMAGQIPAKTKRKRRDLAMAEQHKVAQVVAESFVGRTMKVLVEGEASARQLQAARVDSWEHGFIRETDEQLLRLKGRYLVARSEADAPDIDGRVYLRGQLPVGEFARVRIVGHTDYDLIAEPNE